MTTKQTDSKPAARGKLPAVVPPTFAQLRRETLRAYALPDAPILTPSEDEYQGPTIAMLEPAFPGQITVEMQSPWLWSRDAAQIRPPEIDEASKVYFASGAKWPLGPAVWFDAIVAAKRGNSSRFSPYTTIYVPIDLFANIDEQIRESKQFCETAKRKLIELSGRRPIRRGAGHDQALAEGIFMVVLREWGRQSIGTIACRFHGRDNEQTRRLTTRKIHSVRKLLKAHASAYRVASRPAK